MRDDNVVRNCGTRFYWLGSNRLDWHRLDTERRQCRCGHPYNRDPRRRRRRDINRNCGAVFRPRPGLSSGQCPSGGVWEPVCAGPDLRGRRLFQRRGRQRGVNRRPPPGRNQRPRFGLDRTPTDRQRRQRDPGHRCRWGGRRLAARQWRRRRLWRGGIRAERRGRRRGRTVRVRGCRRYRRQLIDRQRRHRRSRRGRGLVVRQCRDRRGRRVQQFLNRIGRCRWHRRHRRVVWRRRARRGRRRLRDGYRWGWWSRWSRWAACGAIRLRRRQRR